MTKRDLRPIRVDWVDAHGGSYKDWQPLKKSFHTPETCTTVGLCYQNDKVGITVVLSKSRQGDFDSYVFIPACMITGVEWL